MSSTTAGRPTPGYFARLAVERPDIALCRASSVVARTADQHAAEQGLGVGHHLVLKMLAAVGACSQQALSEELRIDRSVMVGIADDLEDAGLIRRERNMADRRAYAVTITDVGRRVCTAAAKSEPELLERAFGRLTATERRQLATILGKLLHLD
jgi:DNA-binding MarR family transcriptional regulator